MVNKNISKDYSSWEKNVIYIWSWSCFESEDSVLSDCGCFHMTYSLGIYCHPIVISNLVSLLAL